MLEGKVLHGHVGTAVNTVNRQPTHPGLLERGVHKSHLLLGPEGAHSPELLRESIVQHALVGLVVGPDLEVGVLDVNKEMDGVFATGEESRALKSEHACKGYPPGCK